MSGWRKRQIDDLINEVPTDTSGKWVAIENVKILLEKVFKKEENKSTTILDQKG